MAAELGSPNADNYMHMVRSRAGLPDIAVNQENIMKERARELAFEGIRYWDLLRQGVEVMADAVVATASRSGTQWRHSCQRGIQSCKDCGDKRSVADS